MEINLTNLYSGIFLQIDGAVKQVLVFYNVTAVFLPKYIWADIYIIYCNDELK